MATLEKNYRKKVKKGNKTKACIPNREVNREDSDSLCVSRQESKPEASISLPKNLTQVTQPHTAVGDSISGNITHQIRCSTNERPEVVSNETSRDSDFRERLLPETSERDGEGIEVSANVAEIEIGEPSKEVANHSSDRVRTSKPPEIPISRLYPSISPVISLVENEPLLKISETLPSTVDGEGTKCQSKDSDRGESSAPTKSAKANCSSKKATVDCASVVKIPEVEPKIKYVVPPTMLSPMVNTLPSAPSCDISMEDDNLVRMRCLEEDSFRNLYPLQAFHVILPSEPTIRSHPLYVLLCDYLLACSHLDRSQKRHETLVSKAEELHESIWTISEKEVVETGKCNDGALLVANYCKSVAVKDKGKLSQLSSTLLSAREALHSEICLHLFDSEAQRLRVENFVQVEEEAQTVIPSPEELRICVVILFSFAQRQDLYSPFLTRVQGWLLRLGKVLLEVAVPSDHLLLLSQLLHCPKGVGKWGTPLVQFHPPPPHRPHQSATKQCLEFELIMAALPILIEALEYSSSIEAHQKKESNDAWVVLDSDGEEEHYNLPGDEDLTSFLDQFPLKAVVMYAVGLSSIDHSLVLSGVDILKLFALSNYCLKAFGSGLQKCGSRRYPCFFRKIAGLVHHIVHLVTDLWDFFKLSKHYHCDPAMQTRIEVEYEALFVRAFGYLFQCTLHNIGWEMLSELPYKYLSIHALWHLLAFIHRCERVNCDGDIIIPPGGIEGWVAEIKDSCTLFDTALLAEREEDSSLLLITMKNMAISTQDVSFAEAVTVDIFRVGLVMPEARGKGLSKTANELLVSICSKHPCLFSVLIGWLKDSSEYVEKEALDLFSSLPLHLWKPSKSDLKLLSSWIVNHDPQTMKSAISRTILLALPWRGSSNEEGPLPLDVTVSAAALALDACLIWDSKGRIPSAMRFESVISSWAWSLVSVLCIHPMERKQCQTWSQDTSSDYDLLLDVLSRGLRENHPLASLLSVLATQEGHTWDMAREHAFIHLSNVVAYGKHSAAIFALCQILPMFVDRCDDLISCQSFQKLLTALLYADRTYVKMAKNLIHPEFPGPNLLQLGNMIVSILEKSYRFSASPSAFVVLWLKCILQLPNWKNEMEALYLLDLIFRSAFFDSSGRGWEEALTIFSQVTKQNMLHVQASTGTFSTIMNLLARGPAPGTPRPFSHMAQSSYSNLPWFVLAAVEVEEVHESFLWDQLQIEYRTAVYALGRFSLDTIIKNACQTLGVLPFPAAYLCIYRWARQALDTPVGHPALLLIWARFFSIYNKLFSCSEQSCCMLFEGSSFSALLVQIKKKLNESVEWYSREASTHDDHDTSLWLKHCSRLFHAFSLWLDGGKRSYQSPVHSPQYSPSRLQMVILHENRRSWQKEFVDITQVKNQIATAVKDWNDLRRDFTEILTSPNYIQASHYSPPLQRIYSRLSLCSDPIPLPFPSYSEPVLRLEYPQIVCGKEAASKAIVNCLTPLLEYARLSSLHFSEHTALDCAFIELLPNLYRDVWVEFTRKVPCSPKISNEDGITPSCKGPAVINFKVKESRVCEEVWADMERNAAGRKRLMSAILKSVPSEACFSGVLLENMARDLVSERKRDDILRIQETALCALNHLLRALSDEAVMHCLPAKKLVTSCIESLVHEFVLGNEKQFLELLSQMLENPLLSEILSPLLTPADLSTNGLLQAYSMLVTRLSCLDSNLAFVLLSKFKIRNWLTMQLSLKQERLSLVKLLISGISCCNSESHDGDWTQLIGLFQKHLRLVVIHRFPEILVEVLELILIAIGDHHLPPLIWYDLLDAIISMGCLKQSKNTPVSAQNAEGSPDQWSLLVKEFSMLQKVLSLNQIKDAVILFATFFRRERLHFGLHGLYPKYRTHIKPIEKFLELLGCSLLGISLREKNEILTSASTPVSTWLSIRDMYSPWLLPYWEDELTGSECTVWIMELINGHPPLTPWIVPDSSFAKDVSASFVKCLQFMIEIAPGHQNSLGLIWEMYCSAFARMGVGSHVLQIIHTSLLMLPWNRFWPTVKNLKDMVEVAESSSPECHCFLRIILSRVHWKEWTDSLSSSTPLSAQALACFLKVLLLISGKICSCKTTDCSLLPTLLAAETISWQNLNVSEYSNLLELYVSRVNPKVVLSWNDPENGNDESIALLRLFKTAGGLAEPILSKDSFQRSLLFLHTIVQLLLSIIESDQYVSLVKPTCDRTLMWLLHEMERLVPSGAAQDIMEQEEKMANVINHVLVPVLPKASPKFILAFSQAVAPKFVGQPDNQPSMLCARGILLALQSSGLSPMHLGSLVESAIETSLLDKINFSSVMANVQRILLNGGENMLVIGNSLSIAGHILTLMAYLHYFCSEDTNVEKSKLEEYLHQLIHRWLPTITITDDNEAKIPLLWAQSLVMCHKLIRMCPKESIGNSLEDLSVLASSLMVLGDGNEGMVSSLLGVVGLKRRPSLSRRFRVICLAFSAFVYACLEKEGIQESQFKEAVAGLDNLCCRYKDFREVTIITSSVTNNLGDQSFIEGTELLIKLFGRLFPEKPGYLQCMK